MSSRQAIAAAMNALKPADFGSIEDHEDPFLKFGFNSMEIFAVLAKLERTLDVVIGEDASEFEQMRTFGGFVKLLDSKLVEPSGLPAQVEGTRS